MAEDTDSIIERKEPDIERAFAGLSNHRLNPSFLTFDRLSTIGSGGGGTRSVHLGAMKTRWLARRNVVVAVKVMNIVQRTKRANRLRAAMDVLQEVSVWTTLEHPNILPCLGFYLGNDYSTLWLISPYLSGGNLWIYLTGTNPSADERWLLATDTAEALKYLHTRTPPLYHGDLKSMNVLMSNERRALLCDFGSSGTEDSPHSPLVTSDFTIVATAPYQSPEQCEGKPRTLKSDMWSWGCVLLEIFTSQRPYKTYNNDGAVAKALLIDKVLPANLAELDLPASIRNLIEGCWKWEPESRLSVDVCLDVLSSRAAEIRKTPPILIPLPVEPSLDSELDEAIVVPVGLERYRVETSRISFKSSKYPIGQGGFATVYRGCLNREFVAVKCLYQRASETDSGLTTDLLREASIWEALQHPNVLPFIGFCHEPRNGIAWLISPHMGNGTLVEYLLSTKPSAERRIQLAYDTARGLDYLHSRSPPVIHGDVKPSNFLVNDEGVAVLFDFGLSGPVGKTAAEQAVTLAFLAPEVFDGQRKSTQCEVWAWGCTLLEIISGDPPYKGLGLHNQAAALLSHVIRGDQPGNLHDIENLGIRDIMTSCWEREPEDRTTMGECVERLAAIQPALPAGEASTAMETRSSGRPSAPQSGDAHQALLLTSLHSMEFTINPVPYQHGVPEPIFYAPKQKDLPLKPSVSTRSRHIRLLNDLLHLSIQRAQWQRAKSIWAILARCPEFDWREMYNIGLLLLHHNHPRHATDDDDDSSFDSDGGGEDRATYIRLILTKQSELSPRRESILLELVLELIAQGKCNEALDELVLYMPSFPYENNPTLHTYAALLNLYLAQPMTESTIPSPAPYPIATSTNPDASDSSSIPRPDFSAFSVTHLKSAQHYLKQALTIDPANTCAQGFMSLVNSALPPPTEEGTTDEKSTKDQATEKRKARKRKTRLEEHPKTGDAIHGS
ncbi:hypothetical protein FRB99_008965 [Tulasnella sp. 403]|nr:hypothetical protein FRB99_008965 [Tulasnella sp. 403]